MICVLLMLKRIYKVFYGKTKGTKRQVQVQCCVFQLWSFFGHGLNKTCFYSSKRISYCKQHRVQWCYDKME